MSQKVYKVPRWLDLPEKILIFTIDEFLVFLLIAALGIMFLSLWAGIPAAGVTTYIMRKFKGGERSAMLMHWIYWITPETVMRWKAIPPSHERFLAG